MSAEWSPSISRGHYLKYLTLTPAWMINHTRTIWNKITYPFPNCSFEIWKEVSNSISNTDNHNNQAGIISAAMNSVSRDIFQFGN